MITRLRAGAVLVCGAVLLAGCASTPAKHDPPATPASSGAPGMSMSPGMVMPDGSTMGAATARVDAATAAAPSAAATMVCSAEIRTDVAKVLGLTSVPAPKPHWSDNVYTCTYQLPMGTFVVSVTEAASAAAAESSAVRLRSTYADARTALGLTTTAFSTSGGLVALVKDKDTLQVDASRLPEQFGAQQEKRTDFAYEIASDILGCWTEG